MTLLINCKYLIYVGILLCILILSVLYIKNMIHTRKKLELFEAEVLEYHNTDTTSSPNDKKLQLSLTKLADKQNKDSAYDQNIDESQLAKV
jgi:hypothetical protein